MIDSATPGMPRRPSRAAVAPYLRGMANLGQRDDQRPRAHDLKEQIQRAHCAPTGGGFETLASHPDIRWREVVAQEPRHRRHVGVLVCVGADAVPILKIQAEVFDRLPG
jgi:hypothetical protein